MTPDADIRFSKEAIIMNTVFSLLSSEPIENVITCLNRRIDKVVYFGTAQSISSAKDSLESFLKKYCRVQSVAFRPIPRHNIDSISNIIAEDVQKEIFAGNSIFFDITGEAGPVLIGFGRLAREFGIPIHLYDVAENKLREYNPGISRSLSGDTQPQQIELDIRRYIELRGGTVDFKFHKSIKDLSDLEFAADADKIWKIAEKYWDIWTAFSECLRREFPDCDGLSVIRRTESLTASLARVKSRIRSIHKLSEIIDALARDGILTDIKRSENHYGFSFKNQKIKDCLWDGGSILELHTYMLERPACDDCFVGVHLDWNRDAGGSGNTPDVLNEVDVLSLKGYIPTFISCKAGNMSGNNALYALYELETVASRFGGKYAKKVLVSVKKLSAPYLQRAREMGIEVR